MTVRQLQRANTAETRQLATVNSKAKAKGVLMNVLVKTAGVALATVVALGLGGCAGGMFPTPSPTPTPVDPTGDGVLVIGDLTPLTGPYAPTSLAQMAGVELAARELNDAGGFGDKSIQVLHRNAGDGDAAVTSASVKALLDKGADIIIVPAVAQVATLVAQETAEKNVAIVTIAAPESAPAGANTTPVEADATFKGLLSTSDPALSDFRYGAEAYDLTIAAALAAHVTADDGGSSLKVGLAQVTAPSGISCTSYGMCLDILNTQPAINYVGFAGQINYDPATGLVYFGAISTSAPTSSPAPTKK